MKSLRLLAVAVLTALPAFAAETPKALNMIVILADDLRWDDLGCAGHPFSKTLHMGRIAASPH